MFIKRRVAAALVMSILVVGSVVACESGSEEADAASTRTVTDALGTATIPADPTMILALDEHSAMSMLVAGVKPDLVYATVDSATSIAVLTKAGVRVEPKPNFLTSPDFEQVASERPDLIVISQAGPLPTSIDTLREIAPTVVLSYGKGWKASLLEAGAIFDATETADRVTHAIEDRTADLNSRLPAGATLSIVFGYQNTLNYPSPTAPMSLLAEEVGLTRPASEKSATGEIGGEFIVPFSPEQLSNHDADRMVVLSQTYYDADFVRSQSLFSALTVAEGNHAVNVDGETWWGNSIFTTWWILDDLDAIFLDHGEVGVVANAADRWDELQKVTS